MRMPSVTGFLLAAVVALPTAATAQEGVDETIERFLKADSTLATWFETAAGYAVFPSVGKGGIGIGGVGVRGLARRRYVI